MTTRTLLVAAAGVSVAIGSLAGAEPTGEPTAVRARVTTAPLYNYEDAPATPDADDPAIWTDRRDPRRSLVIGTAKDAGLVVYDLSGRLLQAIRPPNAPPGPARRSGHAGRRQSGCRPAVCGQRER